MKNGEDLQMIRRQVGMFFDHALNQEDEKKLLERVEHDPVYNRAFNREKSIREHIKNHVHRPGVSPDLIRSIKDHIRMV